MFTANTASLDDVLEFTNATSFPNPGEEGKLYVALDNNQTYRWNGSQYVEMSASVIVYGLRNIQYNSNGDIIWYEECFTKDSNNQPTGTWYATQVSYYSNTNLLLANKIDTIKHYHESGIRVYQYDSAGKFTGITSQNG